MQRVIVYTTVKDANSDVLEYLKKQGCDPVALEKPAPNAVFVHGPSRYVRDGIEPLTYIAVPVEQELNARRALQKFEENRRRCMSTICDTLRFQLVIASIITLVAGAVAWLTYTSRDMLFPLLLGIWLATFIFVAHVGRFHASLARQRALNAWYRHRRH